MIKPRKKPSQTNLDDALSKIYSDEDLEAFGGFGIPSPIYGDDTEEFKACPDCDGEGEYALLVTIKKCGRCEGSGLI